MVITLIIIASMVSAALFDMLPVLENSRIIFTLQKESIQIMSNAEFSDDQKQKILLSNSGKVFYVTLKLVLLFVLVLLPFTLLVAIGDWLSGNIIFYETIVSVKGIVLSSIAFVVYFLLKKGYGRFKL